MDDKLSRLRPFSSDKSQKKQCQNILGKVTKHTCLESNVVIFTQ